MPGNGRKRSPDNAAGDGERANSERDLSPASYSRLPSSSSLELQRTPSKLTGGSLMHDPHSKGIAFGKVPLAVVSSGSLASLNRSEIAAYMAIAAHTNSETWAARPSIATIAHCAGICERTAQRAVAQLQNCGLIIVKLGGGKHVCSTYTLATNPDTMGVTVSGSIPRRPSVTVSDPIPRQSEAHTVTRTTPYGDKNDPIPRHSGVTRTEEQPNSRTAGAATAAAAAGNDDFKSEIIEALRAAGVGNPARDRLARTTGVTAELVQREAARIDGTGKGAGILIENIKTAAAKGVADFDRQTREQADTAEKCRATSEKLAGLQKANADAKELIETLSDGRVAELHREALNKCPEIKRVAWELANPRSYPEVMREIARLARKSKTEVVT